MKSFIFDQSSREYGKIPKHEIHHNCLKLNQVKSVFHRYTFSKIPIFYSSKSFYKRRKDFRDGRIEDPEWEETYTCYGEFRNGRRVGIHTYILDILYEHEDDFTSWYDINIDVFSEKTELQFIRYEISLNDSTLRDLKNNRIKTINQLKEMRGRGVRSIRPSGYTLSIS